MQVSPGNSSQEAFVQLISDYAVPFVYLDTSYPLKVRSPPLTHIAQLFSLAIHSRSPGWACLQGRFEDNGFLLLPRTPRKITFHATSADGPIDIAHFQRELVVRSPRDVY